MSAVKGDRVPVRVLVMVVWLLSGAPAVVWEFAGRFGHPFGDMLHDANSGFRMTASVGLWALFGLVVVMLMLPGAAALTTIRIVVPANALLVIWAVAVTDNRSWAAHLLVAGAASAAANLVLTPDFGDRVVDASSYGDERRFLLKTPGVALVALVVPTWAAAVAGVTVGPLLLADSRWVAGGVVTALGLPVAALAFRALHRLARRWLVFVPAGLVIHDHVAVAAPVPVMRRNIAMIGPAREHTTATDLTATAFGMALEVRLSEPISAMAPTAGGDHSEQQIEAVLVSPARPAAVLATAATRGITIEQPPKT